MAWFRRKEKGIQTPTAAKKEVPDGLWFKTPSGKIIHTRELKNNAYVVPDDDYHVRIGSKEYFEILFDDDKFTEIAKDLKPGDPLKFVDMQPYPKRVENATKKTSLNEAIRTAHGKMNGIKIMIACMDFSYIGGSMGSVVGEKIARSVDYCIKNKVPFLMISKSGGARMQEASAMVSASTSHHCSVPASTFARSGAQ